MRRILLCLLAILLLTSAGCSKTDAEYDELANAYLLGENTSSAASDANDCRLGRTLLETLAKQLGEQKAELAGADADTIRTAIADHFPGPTDGHWSGCPAGGEYAIRYYPGKPLNGKPTWRTEVSCSVHTPEAYKRYEDGLDD